ncbi:hypothetical protein GCM10007978_45100 [Shewanella hanedai]|jgi:hypothetical protein|nr:hypothetical protein GCM10007978_45100 [Shewanella hanedai]
MMVDIRDKKTTFGWFFYALKTLQFISFRMKTEYIFDLASDWFGMSGAFEGLIFTYVYIQSYSDG